VMLMLEITVTSYGVLALGGTTAMILGSLFLINRDFPYYQISWSVMLPVFTLAIIVTWLVIQFGVQALRTRTRTGNEGMVGLTGLAKTDLDPQGKIFVQGEIWNAVSSSPVPEGQPIQITHLDGLTAHVKPVESQKESR